ncbi:hypothetical protein EG329_001194 [Mollisiaceae sp. DMI_Dod_QoI]|nr:hypothetical protein EG329_001194 [Helotiales sp. DMI_Dod_QoI]
MFGAFGLCQGNLRDDADEVERDISQAEWIWQTAYKEERGRRTFNAVYIFQTKPEVGRQSADMGFNNVHGNVSSSSILYLDTSLKMLRISDISATLGDQNKEGGSGGSTSQPANPQPKDPGYGQ